MKTIKARIRVMVAASGRWAALGHDGIRMRDADDALLDMMEGDLREIRSYWIVAELPVISEAIAAEVENETTYEDCGPAHPVNFAADMQREKP